MGLVADGREIRRLLQDGISGVQGGDTVGHFAPHKFNVVVDAVVCHWVEGMVESVGR